MTYQQTLDYLYLQLPMFSRIGAAAYKKDLHNTVELCNVINNPQTKFKSIHIAGTNGKGSTSHMLAAMLQQAGYKTGLYTSPHLKDFRERIKINGEMIEEDFIISFVEKMKDFTQTIEPSFFELTVAMAFEYFAEQKVDIAIIETGLGGRLDSTNIITPILSIITNIGYDHMNILGDTLEKIASEKAGIIKPHVPVVIGEYINETKQIFIDKAKEVNAPIYFAQEQFTIHDLKSSVDELSLDVEDITDHCRETFKLDLNGIYQAKNLLAVLSAEGIISKLGFNISNDAEKYALSHVKQLTGLHGRWEAIQSNPALILDVGHNEDGVNQIMRQVANLKSQNPDSRFHFVIGFVKDKDIDAVLKLFPADASYYFTHAHIPRALESFELKTKAAAFNLKGDVFENVNDAITIAKQQAGKDDVIIVCGSVFLVGEVEEVLSSE